MNPIGTGKNFPPHNPTWWDKMVSYTLVVGVIVPTISIFMNLLNRTKIIGRENIKNLPLPWILVSNHLTMMDDLFLDPLLISPKVFNGYRNIPFHAPEENNFYKKRLLAWAMRRVKSIPLIRGRGLRQEGMDRLIEAVNSGGLLHIYPEGT
ncbi:MAG: 1-acyl-sn-glycerol-3-phosphate acyltransferase, partial [Candidatus Electryoneaceae bacterium]|nr:1-acyl-sn-glycerol-3-phosphate acyltransferase [Candidatus Electryoneaceae bacterium]